MVGVAIVGLKVFWENLSVIKNTCELESTLKIKSNAVCYHIVFEFNEIIETLSTCIHGSEKLAKMTHLIKK